jgi:peptide/nickel transport system substrate-binding protein
MVGEWVPGDHITMVKNPNYWEEGKPYLDEVRFDYVPDDNSRMLRVQSGESHIGEGVPFSQVESLQGSEGLTIEVKTIARYEGIFLNHKREPFSDLNVRKALNFATDKDSINAAVYGGTAEVANDMIPKGRFTADPGTIPPYGFDLEQAKSLMAASSVPNGFDATFIYPAGSSIHKELATISQAQWAELGVNVTLEEVDQASLFDRYLGGDWDMAVPLVQFTADVTVNDEVALLFYDVSLDDNPIAAFATGWAVPQELYDLTQTAAKSASEEERATLWPQAQQIAMDQAPWVTLFFLPAVTAVRDEVQGFATLPAAWWDLEEVSLTA